jgi:lysozyme family protein
MPMEEISKLLGARRELLKEMFNHQAAELKRLSDMLVAFKQNYDANLERVVHLEANASILAKRSSAVLTATRDLCPQITDAEAAYFKELQRYETSCSKWQGTVEQIKKDASSSCDAMSAGAIENGDVQCLVDSNPQNIQVCQKLLRGEGQMLKSLEKKVKESSNEVDQLLKLSGFSS